MILSLSKKKQPKSKQLKFEQLNIVKKILSQNHAIIGVFLKFMIRNRSYKNFNVLKKNTNLNIKAFKQTTKEMKI